MNNKQIIQALGLENAPAELQEKALVDVSIIIEMRTAGMIEDLMSDEQLETFAKMAKNDTPDVVREWINKEVVDAEKLYEATLSDYIAEKQQ